MFLKACKPKNSKVNRAFYFWKSSFALNNFELDIIKQNKVNTLYIKYFDVVWNDKLNAAIPVAKINFKQAVPFSLTVVPVVYITNNSLQKTNNNDIEKLANNISVLINSYQSIVKNNTSEIQIDCDWTLITKQKYFALLNALRNKFGNDTILSATIRLHQIKYAATTGIPPVQKGMLMYYNMGNINSHKNNAIFNEKDAAKYAPYIKQYALPLDAVLPVFSWIKVFRNHRMKQLISHISAKEFLQTGFFKQMDENRFQAITTSNYKGVSFLSNDIFIIENISPSLSKRAANHLNNYFAQTQFTLALFHLNQSNLNEYTTQDFEDIYTSFY